MKMSSARCSLAVASFVVLLVTGCGIDSDTDSQSSDDWVESEDGGSTADTPVPEPDGEADGRGDAGTASSNIPEQYVCSDEQTELFEVDTPQSPEPPAVPFEVIDSEFDEQGETFEGDWQGVVSLDSRVSLNCPPSIADPGLDCDPQQAVAVEHTVEGETETLQIALALPFSDIDWPDEGTSVEIEYERPGFLTMRETSSSEEFVALGVNGVTYDGETFEFGETHNGFELSMPQPIDNLDSAECLGTDKCRRVLRSEPLVIDADDRHDVGTGESTSLQTDGASFRLWHTASIRRHYDIERMACADQTPQRAGYGFAKLK